VAFEVFYIPPSPQLNLKSVCGGSASDQIKSKPTHLFHYPNHTQQKLRARWDVGKHALQTNRSNMVFTKVTKYQRKINYVKKYAI